MPPHTYRKNGKFAVKPGTKAKTKKAKKEGCVKKEKKCVKKVKRVPYKTISFGNKSFKINAGNARVSTRANLFGAHPVYPKPLLNSIAREAGFPGGCTPRGHAILTRHMDKSIKELVAHLKKEYRPLDKTAAKFGNRVHVLHFESGSSYKSLNRAPGKTGLASVLRRQKLASALGKKHHPKGPKKPTAKDYIAHKAKSSAPCYKRLMVYGRNRHGPDRVSIEKWIKGEMKKDNGHSKCPVIFPAGVASRLVGLTTIDKYVIAALEGDAAFKTFQWDGKGRLMTAKQAEDWYKKLNVALDSHQGKKNASDAACLLLSLTKGNRFEKSQVAKMHAGWRTKYAKV